MTDDQKKQVAAAVRMQLENKAEEKKRGCFFGPVFEFPAPTAAEFSRQSSGDEVDEKQVEELLSHTDLGRATLERRRAAVSQLKQNPTGRMVLAQQRAALRSGIGCGMTEAAFNELLKKRGLSF